MYEYIDLKEEYGVLRVIFSVRQNMISITHGFLEELNQVMDLAEQREDIKVITLEGQKGLFCTGMDFQEAQKGKSDDLFYHTMKRFTVIPKYIIAKVDGKAIGGGVGLAAASDIVLASKQAEFSLSEAIWGLLPCMVMPFLMRRTGFQTAYRMTITTMPVGCLEAYEHKLADYQCDDVDAECRKIQRRIMRMSCSIIGEAKQYCNCVFQDNEHNEQKLAVDEFNKLFESKDVQENIFNYVTYKKFPWEK